MATITNAVPRTVLLGIQDMSRRTVPNTPEQLPTHLAKTYFFAQEGPITGQVTVGDSRTNIYGAATFDPLSPFFNHGTVLSNTINAQGNAQMSQRVRPTDAPGPATIRLTLDLLVTRLFDYQRNTDGTFKLDENGDKIPVGPSKITGHKLKIIQEVIEPNSEDGSDMFGKGARTAGDQTDADTSTQSLRYPFLDLRVPSFGSKGNDKGMRLWAPTQSSATPPDSRIIANEKTYLFRVGCMLRDSDLTTGYVANTLVGDPSLAVSFKPKAMDREYANRIAFQDTFVKAYNNLNDPVNPPTFGPFGESFVYDDNLKEVLDLLYAAEIPFKDSEPGLSDFTGEDDEQYRFNFIGGKSSYDVPYHTLELVTEAGSVRLSESSVLWAQGGGDGTMNLEMFDTLVGQDMAKYLDPNSEYQNMPLYPESFLYDSGYGVATKKKLAQFIAVRKDTMVVLGTHVVGNPAMTAAEESSLAISLRTALQLYPESSEFGTSTCRAMIIGRSGVLADGTYDERLPLTIELASKAADYMGAASRIWKNGRIFDHLPLASIDLFTDINATVTGVTARTNDWKNGLNWVENFTRKSVSWPALKTVYPDDTSVLTSFFNVAACVELEKVGDRARRQYSGTISHTEAQLIEAINEYITGEVAGRFDGKITVVPVTTIEGLDAIRGYSWTTIIKVYAENMRTVGQLTIQSYRAEDLTT